MPEDGKMIAIGCELNISDNTIVADNIDYAKFRKNLLI